MADSEPGTPRKKKKASKGRRGSRRRGRLKEPQTNYHDDHQDTPREPPVSEKKTKTENTASVCVPDMLHYVLGPIASDNEFVHEEQQGVFATKDMEAGTCIISEEAVITLPSPGDQLEELWPAFLQLPQVDQSRIWKLKPAPLSASRLLDALANHIDPIVARAAAIIIKDKNARTKDEAAELEQSRKLLIPALPAICVGARWHAGRFSLINESKDDPNQLPKYTHVDSLFIETAALRHSCVPNCYAYYHVSSGRMTVQTVAPITVGEELTLSSIGGLYYLKVSDRAAGLQGNFGVFCKCEACDSSHPMFKTHEGARTRAHARAMQLEQFLTILEVVDSNDVLDNLCLDASFRSEHQPAQDALEDHEQMSLDIIKDLRTTGCAGLEIIRWFNVLIDRLQPRIAEVLVETARYTRWKIIQLHVLTCVKLAKICLGEDTEEFDVLQTRMLALGEVVTKAGQHAAHLKN